MNKRKQIIMEIVLSDNIWHVQENIQHFGFETVQQYIDYLDSCYGHVSDMNWDIFREEFLHDYYAED